MMEVETGMLFFIAILLQTGNLEGRRIVYKGMNARRLATAKSKFQFKIS